MRWSIRYRLFVPLGLLLMGIVVISAWVAVSSAHHAEERISQQVHGVISTLSSTSISPNERILGQMKGLSGAEFLFVDESGRRTSTFASVDFDIPNLDTASVGEPAQPHRLGSPIEIEGHRFLWRRLPHRSGGYYYIFYPVASLNEAIRETVRPSIFVGSLGGLIAILLTLLLGQHLVQRIRVLEKRTRQIALGDFSPMPLPVPNDELRDLAQSVNDMAQKLALYQDTVRASERLRLLSQLANGLAHQLRNAATGARLAVQVHLADCPLHDQEALQVTLRQLDLMDTNLSRFMKLGHEAPSRTQRCDIVPIIEEALDLWHPRADHVGITLRFQRACPVVRTTGDPELWRDIFLNLIGNAMDAVGGQGSIEVLLNPSPDNSHAIIEVVDSGPGPPADIAERLFESFVTGKKEGIGLGLTLVKHTLSSCMGTISWHRQNEKTVFRVEVRATFE